MQACRAADRQCTHMDGHLKRDHSGHPVFSVASLPYAGMQGGWLWTWKDGIDRAFMAKFGAELDFSGMLTKAGTAGAAGQQPLEAALGPEELALLAAARTRCAGCGSKVGATSLGRVLRRLQEEGDLGGSSAGGITGSGSGNGDAGSSCGGSTQQQQQVLLGLDQPDDAAVLEPPPPGHVTVRRCRPACRLGCLCCLASAAAA